MRKAIVTVKCDGAPFALDLELPVDADSVGLARAAALAFGQDGEFRVEVTSLGRPLNPTETLAAAGVWDGAWLLLKLA
ncbi:MAG TPA: EsaB/YukD family protein [Symbiobacteriaceae bacterium]|nr:EsaB/YukD family protein [Symbiobacteriaceae bacterium]